MKAIKSFFGGSKEAEPEVQAGPIRLKAAYVPTVDEFLEELGTYGDVRLCKFSKHTRDDLPTYWIASIKMNMDSKVLGGTFELEYGWTHKGDERCTTAVEVLEKLLRRVKETVGLLGKK